MLGGAVICFHPRPYRLRVFTLVRHSPARHLDSGAVLFDVCPLKGQVSRTHDALSKVRKAVLRVTVS